MTSGLRLTFTELLAIIFVPAAECFFRQFRDMIEVCDTEYEDSDPEFFEEYEPASDDDSDPTEPGSSGKWILGEPTS